MALCCSLHGTRVLPCYGIVCLPYIYIYIYNGSDRNLLHLVVGTILGCWLICPHFSVALQALAGMRARGDGPTPRYAVSVQWDEEGHITDDVLVHLVNVTRGMDSSVFLASQAHPCS